MPKIKNIPFGYEMLNGIIVTKESEEIIVRKIFTGFVQGIPVSSIYQSLNSQGISYSAAHPIWNKNTVYRILEDKRYLGDDNFPQIVSEEAFLNAADIRKNSSGTLNSEIRSVRKKIVCSSCHSSMHRLSGGNQGYVAWECAQCQTKTIRIPDSSITSHVHQKICQIVDNPDCCFMPIPKSSPSLTMAKLTVEFERGLSDPDVPNDELLQLAQRIAQEQYRECKSGEVEADNQWLMMLICKKNNGLLSEEEFIDQAIQEIALSANGQISVRLVNNKIL